MRVAGANRAALGPAIEALRSELGLPGAFPAKVERAARAAADRGTTGGTAPAFTS